MRRLKRIAALLIAGFLAFAPPGTLVFIALVILQLLGTAWLVAGGILFLVALAAWLLRRRFLRKPKQEKITPSAAP